MFSKTAEYALRAVVTIARLDAGRSVLAKEIAVESHVPDKYLSKVLRDLVRAGILSSTRGIGGGFRLRRRPQSLKLIDVVRPFDDVFEMRRCLFGHARCSDDSPCPVHEQWKPVISQFRQFLEETTINDLLVEQ